MILVPPPRCSHAQASGHDCVLRPDQSAEGALAAKQGTSTIPIVAVSPADAVAMGLVASLARPGANVTGLSYLGTELIAKQVELLKEAVPNLSRVAALSNPANPTHAPRLRAAAIGAQGLRVQR